MDWPRCEDCGELLCPSGKGEWECIEKHAVLERQRNTAELYFADRWLERQRSEGLDCRPGPIVVLEYSQEAQKAQIEMNQSEWLLMVERLAKAKREMEVIVKVEA